VIDELEQRLRAYGATIDAATAADLAERDDHLVEAGIVAVDRHPRRIVTIVVVLAVAGAATVGVLAMTGLSGLRGSNNRPSSTVPHTACARLPIPRALNCRALKRFRVQPLRTSKSGSGTDGDPTPAQAAALAVEVKDYPQAVVERMIAQGRAHGQQPDNQAIVEALEFQNACIQIKRAATTAESAPPGQVASVVHAIMDPEIARLIQRSTSGSTSYQLFQRFDDQIIAGEARQVLRDNIGVTFCIYMRLPGPKLPGS